MCLPQLRLTPQATASMQIVGTKVYQTSYLPVQSVTIALMFIPKSQDAEARKDSQVKERAKPHM